jgi:IPT/TIG domain/Type II secretion system (T2SS), protein G
MQKVILTLVALTGIGACGHPQESSNARSGGASCAATASRMVETLQAADRVAAGGANLEMLGNLRAVLANRCVEDTWSEAAVTCFGAASGEEQIGQCQYKHLTQEQKDKLERAVVPILQASGFGRASKEDIATVMVKKYAYEAYPSWAASHPDRMCPDRLQELTEYMSEADVTDPWGQPYRMMCGANLPPGAKGIAVMSSGKDGKEGTVDDIRSWDDQDVRKPPSPPPSGAAKLSVTGVEPARGDAQGGTYVLIKGARFTTDGPRNAKVYFGARQGAVVRFASDSELIVEAPGGKLNETVDVLIIFDPGGQIRIPGAFTFVEK